MEGQEFEDEDLWNGVSRECEFCGCDLEFDEHMKGCPKDDSPYAQLLKDGYD